MMSILSARADIATGRQSSRTLVEQCLERALNSFGEGSRTFTKLNADESRLAAEAQNPKTGDAYCNRPLSGIPISIKDVFDVRGELTLGGSKVLTNSPIAVTDSEIVRRLRLAGAILMGRTNMSEFAFSAVGHNPHYGTPGNPWDRTLIPGGSSSGAAVSVADGMALGAIGSDTGGSIRIPAALCGLAGFKPTKARVSTNGMLPLSATLDSVGPIARTIAECRLIDSIISKDGHYSNDILGPRALRFAVPRSLVMEELDELVEKTFNQVLRRLVDHGAHIEKIDFDLIFEVQIANARGGFPPAEAFAWHERLIETSSDEYDPRALARFESGRNTTAAHYIRLNWHRNDLIDRSAAIIGEYDALLVPTCPIIAPAIASVVDDNAEFDRINKLLSRNTAPFNFLDCCAATIPIQHPGEAPVGMMIVGNANTDQRILAISDGLERFLRNLR